MLAVSIVSVPSKLTLAPGPALIPPTLVSVAGEIFPVTTKLPFMFPPLASIIFAFIFPELASTFPAVTLPANVALAGKFIR